MNEIKSKLDTILAMMLSGAGGGGGSAGSVGSVGSSSGDWRTSKRKHPARLVIPAVLAAPRSARRVRLRVVPASGS